VNDWPDAEKWAKAPLMFMVLCVFGLIVYGVGTVALWIVCFQQGRSWELFTLAGIVIWGWGLVASLVCLFCIVTVFRARVFIRRRKEIH